MDSKLVGGMLEPLIHFTVAALIGWGIYKKYKVATITGLILAIIGLITNSVTGEGINRTSIIMLVCIWIFIQSTRGIFAYHKIIKNTEIEETTKV